VNLYSLVLFLHVTADIGIFIGIGVQLLCLVALRRAQTVEQARSYVQLIRMSDPLSTVSALVTIAAGFYMMLTVWGWRTGWINVALGSILVLLAPLIGAAIEPRMKVIVALSEGAPSGQLPEELRSRLHDPVLATALQSSAAVVFGIVFLMTNKPSLAISIAVMAVFLALGLVSGLPFWYAARADHASRA